MKPDAQMPNPRLWMVVFSPPKVGKTRLLGTAIEDPRLTPALIIDFEGGTSVIQSKLRPVTMQQLGKQPAQDKIDVFRVTKWMEINPLLTAVVNTNAYRLVCVDSLTELSYLALTAKAAGYSQPYPDIRSYGELTVDMRGLFRVFRDQVKAHVVFTAQTKDRERQENTSGVVVPAMAGAEVTRDVCGVVDLLGYLERTKRGPNQLVTTIHFEQRGTVLAGSRVENPDFPNKFDNPTLGSILTALEGGKDEQK